ncbi:hypothetical protein N9I56_07680, partial [Alphaproteobacteria bacterium]|nr:hypothetical protein [Alphaproteobacteria bacterium]
DINIYNTGSGTNSVFGGLVSVDRLLTQTANTDLVGGGFLEFQADKNGQNTSLKLVETTNGVKPGIVIFGVSQYASSGNPDANLNLKKFWYKLDPDGESYEVKVSELSENNALVLPADAFVSFPSGLSLNIEGYGWDGTNHVAGSYVDVTASTNSTALYSEHSLNISVSTWDASAGDFFGPGTGLVMQGTADSDELLGSEYNDFIFDWDGDDTIYAGPGDDIIRSGRGKDYFDGGTPDPANPGGAGSDTSKNDTFLIDFGFSTTNDVEVILGDGTYFTNEYGNREKSDSIRNIEHLQIVAMEGDMKLVGDYEDNIISGSYGNDLIAGEAGDDVLFGGWGEDRFYDSSGTNIIIGGRGEDFAVYGFDIDFNKTDVSYMTYEMSDAWVDANHVRVGIDDNAVVYEARMFDVDDNLISIDYLIDVEGVVGTDGDDYFTGDSEGGADKRRAYSEETVHLNALGLDDENYEAFAPGLGNDYIIGGLGYTELNYAWGSNNSWSVYADLEEGYANIYDGSTTYTDYFSDVDGVEGTFGDDLIRGNGRANSLDGRKGDDVIDGNEGFDYVEYNGGPQGVTVDLNVGVALDQWGYTDSLFSIEGVIGSGHNDVFYDSLAYSNAYYGKSGYDTLIYHQGSEDFDIQKREDGSFQITNIPDNTADVVDGIERVIFNDITINLAAIGPSGPMELIKLGEQNDVFYGDSENQYVISAGGDDEINSGSGDDFIQIDSTSVDDHIVVHAGLGDDTVWVNENFSGILELHADPANSDGNENFDTVEFEGELTGANFDNGHIVLTTAYGGQIKLMNQLELIESNWVVNEAFGFDFLREIAVEDGEYFLNPNSVNEDYLGSEYRVVLFGSDQEDEIYVGWDEYESGVIINGFDGHDILGGSKFDDHISGGDGHDDLYGDMGRDYLEGGSGDDFLNGGEGSDWLEGGSGSDGYNIKFHTEMFLDRDQSEQSNIDLGAWDNVDRITDTGGADDWVGLNVRNGSPNSYTPITVENPFSLNASVQIVDGNLRFVSRIDDTFSFGPFVETGWLDGWHWRDQADEVWDEAEGNYTRGFLQGEDEAFSLYDLTTYPGWSDLSGKEQTFFEELLDPKSEGFLDTLEGITEVYDRAYDHDVGVTQLNYDPDAELVLAFVDDPDAVYPQQVDYENSNVPALLVLKAIKENIENVSELQGFETGFQIENFASTDDTIESLVLFDDFGFDSAIDNIVNELASLGALDSITDVKNEAIKRGVGKEYKFENTGLVSADQSGDFILVAGNYENQRYSEAYKDVYASVGSRGESVFDIVREGEDPDTGDSLYYQGDGIRLSGELSQHYPSEIVGGGSGNDIIYGREGKEYDSALDTNTIDFLFGQGGSDQFYLYGGENLAIGGVDDDVFVVHAKEQDTEIYGDLLHAETNDLGINTNYADKVYIDWVYDSDSIAEISGTNGQGVVVWNDDLGARVEIYDAEELIFRTEDGNWDAGISI